jgi:MinD-like ATPase involved in chromosome partitioning or flagellar assembly
MTRVLGIVQDKGGVGKTVISRGLAEVVPGAPLFEIDSSPRMIELGKRVRFFQMRADREAIELTGGAASRAEFDQVVDAIASATLPTVVDIGANTGVSLLTVIAGLRADFAAAGVEFGVLVVTTAEPGALAEVPKLLSVAASWAAARFVIENRVQGEVDPKMLLKIAAGATVSCLMNQVMDEKAAAILQAGGLASIAKLDAKALNDKFGVAQGSRIRRDLTRVRLEVMQAVRPAAEWLVAR